MFNSLVKTWLTKRSVSTAFAVAALLSINTAAQAQLIAYEGFNYPGLDTRAAIDGAQSLTNVNGGIGWGGMASGGGSGRVTNISQSLTYANQNTLLTTGVGSAFMGVSPVNNVAGGLYGQAVQWQRNLFVGVGETNTLGQMGTHYSGTLWLSFLYQNWQTAASGGGTYRGSYLGFITASSTNSTGGSQAINGTDIFGVGQGNTVTAGQNFNNTDFGMGGLGGNVGFAPSGVAIPRGSNQPALFILLRLDVDNTSANDTISLWVNPEIGLGVGAIGAADATYLTNVSGVNGLRFQVQNMNTSGSNALIAVDELRLGATFDDVTPIPEPATVALAGVALSGLWMAARRRRQA